MSRDTRARLIAVLLVLHAVPARADALTIDLRTAVSRARAHAPTVVAAVGRIDEARAAREGASVWLVQNPQLSVAAGPKFGDGAGPKIMGQVTQQLGAARRGARLDAAAAGVDHARATSDGARSDVGFAAAIAWSEARAAELEIELARRGEAIAARALDGTQRRRKAGEVGDLDVELARVAMGQARAAVASARATHAEAVGTLAALIGAGPADTIALTGSLEPPPLDLDALRAKVPARADVRALEAERRLADAELTLAIANGRPDLGLWVAFEREEGSSEILGGVVLTLPMWNRAQGDKAAARARERRTSAERAAVLGAASRRVLDAYAAYAHARDALQIIVRDVEPALTAAERLADQALDAGQISVGVYVIGQAELLSARHAHLDRRLALARLAAVARQVAGVDP